MHNRPTPEMANTDVPHEQLVAIFHNIIFVYVWLLLPGVNYNAYFMLPNTSFNPHSTPVIGLPIF